MNNQIKLMFWRYKFMVKMIRIFWFLWSVFHPVNGIKVMDEKWDYLIVLDTCRYDYFKQYNYLDGDLKKKQSCGSATYEWLEKNFADGMYDDVVYITANPRIRSDWFRKWILHDSNPFYRIEDVWNEVWDEQLNAVTPWDTTDKIIEHIQKYPSKRCIIHYLQPHAPYIDRDGNRLFGYEHRDFNLYRMGRINHLQITQGYISNLVLVMKEVKKLLPYLCGRVIITADHGECFGEKLLYAHPGKTYVKELVDIPWFVYENDGNKVQLNRSIRKFIKKQIKKNRVIPVGGE